MPRPRSPSPGPRSRPARGVPRRLGAALAYWMPVWVPLVLLGQVALRGLGPALTERERLEQEEARVRERHARARDEFERMASEVQAWQDPVYRERMRRILHRSGPTHRD